MKEKNYLRRGRTKADEVEMQMMISRGAFYEESFLETRSF